MRCSSSPAVHPSFEVSGSPVVAPHGFGAPSLPLRARRWATRSSDMRLGLADGESAARPSMDLGPASESHLTVARRTSPRTHAAERSSAHSLEVGLCAPSAHPSSDEPRGTCLRLPTRGLLLPVPCHAVPSGSPRARHARSPPPGRPLRDLPGVASPRLRCALRFSQPLGASISSLPLRPSFMPVSLMGFAVLQRFSLRCRRRRPARAGRAPLGADCPSCPLRRRGSALSRAALSPWTSGV